MSPLGIEASLGCGSFVLLILRILYVQTSGLSEVHGDSRRQVGRRQVGHGARLSNCCGGCNEVPVFKSFALLHTLPAQSSGFYLLNWVAPRLFSMFRLRSTSQNLRWRQGCGI